MVLIKILYPISSQILVIASQKLVSRIALPYKSIHNNRGIFYDKMVLIFFMNTTAKPHVKKLSVILQTGSVFGYNLPHHGKGSFAKWV